MGIALLGAAGVLFAGRLHYGIRGWPGLLCNLGLGEAWLVTSHVFTLFQLHHGQKLAWAPMIYGSRSFVVVPPVDPGCEAARATLHSSLHRSA